MFANPNIHPYDPKKDGECSDGFENKDVPLVCVDDFDMEKWEI